ncbi:alpha-hydroxy acid oxidase [Pseudolysinimonas sp.]|uniref:alpha-hydroxy acid oxidase n=1 Tax=Pseudolysinimonas sp. TaxID=2680009 RepID=UPI003F7CFED7
MDLALLREAARAAIAPDAWAFYQGTADGLADPERDARAWDRWDFVPRAMTGLTAIDTTVELGGHRLRSPITIAATAAHGGAHPDAEAATAAGATAAGVLMAYSHNATLSVEAFAAAATGPWWAQTYLQRDRAATDDYVARSTAAGASAIVLTVDVPGILADAAFRRQPVTGPVQVRGNVPITGGGAGTAAETAITPDDVARLAATAGVPVWVKGVMAAEDAVRALDAGAAGVVVSNHGRRQLHGVAPVATVLRGIVEAVDGRAPVMVDGGIRSGADVVRALALGAAAVGIGRPALWALAAGGADGVAGLLSGLQEEVAVTLAGVGVGRIADLTREMVRRSD